MITVMKCHMTVRTLHKHLCDDIDYKILAYRSIVLSSKNFTVKYPKISHVLMHAVVSSVPDESVKSNAPTIHVYWHASQSLDVIYCLKWVYFPPFSQTHSIYFVKEIDCMKKIYFINREVLCKRQINRNCAHNVKNNKISKRDNVLTPTAE